MEALGDYVIWVMMAFVAAGAIGAIRDPRAGIGKEFMDGLYSIGPIFVPVAGIMVSIPYLAKFIEAVAAPIFGLVGADPAMAATTFIAVDMGGAQLAKATALTTDGWIMALMVGFTMGATIVYAIPLGLAMIDTRDHKFMALGIMSGVLATPFAMLITTGMLVATGTKVRPEISTTDDPTHLFAPDLGAVVANVIPLVVITGTIALLLYLRPNLMIKVFMFFGRCMDFAIKLVLAASIIEYFTGAFSLVLGSWGFDPMIADADDQFRALEISGYIGLMLAGAFPMVYAINKYLHRPLAIAGQRVGLSASGTTGMLAAATNLIALFHLMRRIPPKDKVLCIAFSVSASALIGDHLAFSANFQPTMIVPLIVGKLVAGILAVGIAYLIAVRTARRLEEADRADGTIGPDEYLEEERVAAHAASA